MQIAYSSVDKEPMCFCCESNVGVRIWASIVIIVELIVVIMYIDFIDSLIIGLINIAAYGYLFSAVSRKDPEQLKRSMFGIGSTWILQVIIGTIFTLSYDYDALSDAIDNIFTASELKEAAVTDLVIEILVSFAVLALTVGFTHQYGQYLLRRMGNQVQMMPRVQNTAPV